MFKIHGREDSVQFVWLKILLLVEHGEGLSTLALKALVGLLLNDESLISLTDSSAPQCAHPLFLLQLLFPSVS